jgi:hypothetical protein
MGANTMLANEIYLGEKTSNAQQTSSTTYTYYRHNEWEDNATGGWHFQNSNGVILNNQPPSFGWNQRPSDYPNTGGLGNTCWSNPPVC